MTVSQFTFFPHKGKSIKLTSLNEAIQSVRKPGFVWFDFCDSTMADLEPLIESLGIHPLSVEDCLDDNQIPKVDVFPANSFLLFNSFTYNGKDLFIDEIDLIISPNYLVTVHGHKAGDPMFFADLPGVVARGEVEAVRGTDFLMHIILDYIVDRKFSAIEKLQEEIDGAEEIILKEPDKFNPADLMRLRGFLLALRKSLFHEREVLIKLCRRDSPFIGEKVIFYYRDIYDHLAKFFEFIEINREMITNLMELYISQKSNQMARISNATNEQMKRLTLITTVFMPMTLLAGVGGMSEWSMMTGSENWKISYPLFLVGMAALGIANYLLLKWKKWF